jgi:hypothetical protein
MKKLTSSDHPSSRWSRTGQIVGVLVLGWLVIGTIRFVFLFPTSTQTLLNVGLIAVAIAVVGCIVYDVAVSAVRKGVRQANEETKHQ